MDKYFFEVKNSVFLYLPKIIRTKTMNPEILIDLVTKTMPFGKYKGRLLCDIPEEYLVWMHGKGFPDGKLGMWLSTLYEIRLNGLEEILRELKTRYPVKR